jgi:DNA invertase Pin-like site-specific DNA recombinase
MRYINYARRSSDEKSKKQIQSIDDQLSDTRRFARDYNLSVVEEMTESRSAKEPGRPVFNAMIEKIRRGEADAILCWKLDRLARNPIDAATLRWMMRQGHLLEIRTPYQVYRPDDNAVITAVESAMAEQYIIDLKKGVERGMKSKCARGGFPGTAPQGYLNDRINATIVVDQERFPVLRKAWRLLIEEKHTVPEIHDILLNQWGYRTRGNKRRPEGLLTLSGLYHLFRNPFYMGSFSFMGTTYIHEFPRMVTKDEWEKAQRIISGRGHKKVIRHKHAFTGLITCASCGFLVTAEKAKGHTYYHCNNKLGICTKKGMRQEEIEECIDELLESITLPPEFEEFAARVLDELRSEDAMAQRKVEQTSRATMKAIGDKKDALLSLFLEGYLTKEEYAAKKRDFTEQEINLRSGNDHENTNEQSHETLENVVRFTCRARSLFQDSEPDVKRLIARHLASGYILNNGKDLQIELNPLFEKVRSTWKNTEFKNASIEHQKNSSQSRLMGQNDPIIQIWCARMRQYRTWLRGCNLALHKI